MQEKDPLTCHRSILVTHFARAYFVNVFHILGDGSIENGVQADERLLKEHNLNEEEFFSSYNERLSCAYDNRAKKIAYEEQQKKKAYG